MAVDRWNDVLALLAGLLGLVVVVMAWPRRASSDQPSHGAHPAARSPVRVRLDTIDDEPRWRVANRHGILDLTIDIVAYRPTGSEQDWVSEPIVEPLRLLPGRSTRLPGVVADPAATYDVVVSWTTHHLDGGAQTTRTFTVGPDADRPAAPVPLPPPASGRGLAVVFGAIAVLLGALTLLAAWRLFDGDEVSVAGDAAPHDGVADSTPPPVTTNTRTPTSITSGTTTTTTTMTTTMTTTPTTTTTTTTTTTSVETAPVATPTSTTPASTTTTTTTSPADPRRVTIEGRIDACRFGPDCLIASFTLVDFPREGEYVCEFEDGSRFTFRYVGDAADDACTSSGPTPSITIEVDGVRSATITRELLGPT